MGNLSIATLVMFVPLAYSLAITIPLVVIDLRERRLPNKLVLPNLAVALLAVLVTLGMGEWQRVLVSLGISALVFFAGLFISVKGWVGMGDVKLLLTLSLPLSWFSVWAMPILLGATLGAMVLVVSAMYFTRRIRLGSTIAMGPYILGSFVLVVANTIPPLV